MLTQVSELWECLSKWTSDSYLFPIMQGSLVMFVMFAIFRERLQQRKAGRGGVTLQVGRGDASMALFYGMYAAISGFLVAVCLTVEIARDHRVLWATVDTALVAYVCLLNPWFRNHLVGWAERLKGIEKK